jgi:hypothetical protein
LSLRAGEYGQAANLLARVVRAFPKDRKWGSLPVDDFHDMDSHTSAGRALGELGTLRLSRRQFTEALDALLRAGYWTDAAYVAEQVLTEAELKAYVDRNWPRPAPASYDPTSHRWWRSSDENRAFELRYLLGRRLTRQGRFSDARSYFPKSLQKTFDDYRRALEEGRNPRRSDAERAESLWTAATIARHSGMEILGTELDPDWAIFGGSFELGSVLEAREEGAGKILPLTPDERARGKAHAVDPYKRFHYRYIAGAHALDAVQLLPENSDRAARMLCIAGSWLKKRDPTAADRFYKLLVRRCGQTELGKEADRLRWFPKVQDTP